MDKTHQNKDAVSQKILETAKETERLKRELEALIASGIQGRQPILPTTSHIATSESANKVQIIKSYDSKHSHHPKKLLLDTPNTAASDDAQTVSPKKPKTYNVDDAREYIKKQREKRMEELKNRKTYTQITAEIRKEKLHELQQKASEIVKKNVEAKRARSKSREPPIVRSRSASKEELHHLKSRSRSGEKRLLGQEESVIEGFNCAGKTRRHIATRSNINAKSKPVKATSTGSLSTVGKVRKEGLSGCTSEGDEIRNKKLDVVDSANLLHVPEFGSGVEEQTASDRVDRAKLIAEELKPLPEANHGSQAEKRSLKTKISPQNRQSNHEPSEVQTDVSQKSTKASSENISLRSAAPELREDYMHTPDWLKEQPQADPYNFINTVKRRLKYAVSVNKPTLVDVAVQGSLDDINSALQSGKSSTKTDLKSFISHKCLHLDPKTVEHIELDRNKVGTFKDGPTITKPSSCSENDSDTSKNIPSISSEGGSSLRRNAEFIKRSYAVSDLEPLENVPPSLDARKVEDIKIQKSEVVGSLLSVPLQDDVERIKKQLFKDSDPYSSDFIATDLSRSRESIISFNCAKVSPNKVPLFAPDTQEAASDSAALSEPAFLGSEISVQSEANSLPSNKLSKASENSLTRNITTRSTAERPSNMNLPQGNSVDSDGEFKRSATSDDMESHGKVRENVKSLSERNDESFGSDGSLRTISSGTRKSESIVDRAPKGSAAGSAASEQAKEGSLGKNVFSKSESNIYADGQTEGPKLSLNIRKRRKHVDSDRQAMMRNITIRSCDNSRENLNDTNEIHLKFEAEIHLLTDFNQTIRRFSEIEKTFESLRSQNDNEAKKNATLENKDTQTSILSTSSSSSKHTTNKPKSSITSEIGTDRHGNGLQLTKRADINAESLYLDLTQATDINNSVNFEDSLLDNPSGRTSSIIHFSQRDIDASSREKSDFGDENAVFKSVAGMSLRMFDQLIKDEDARIENWKKLIKIREQALLDRTRGELVWLEMQKKHLIETGKLSEASLIKKKQRGILLKHQQEKHEMQRLKQMQKEDSQNRKALLKKERNKIKNQLLSDNMLSKLKSHIHRDRSEKRLSGPFKVIQSVHSETSLSKATAATDQEIKSVTTRTSRTHSVVNVLSEISDNCHTDMESIDLRSQSRANVGAGAISNMKKTLLMREHALAKRRKAVEELLQWHKKLLDEEKAIADLESKIGTIISKIPSQGNAEAPKESRTPSSNSVCSAAASMSQIALAQSIRQEENHSEDSNKVVSSANNNYSADFDVESGPQNSDDKSSVSSISQLIEDFSKIEDHILNLSLMPKRPPPSDEEATSDVSAAAADEIQNDTDASVVFVEELINGEQSNGDISIQHEEISEESPKTDSDKEQESVSEQLVTNKVPDDSLSSKSTSVNVQAAEETTSSAPNEFSEGKTEISVDLAKTEENPSNTQAIEHESDTGVDGDLTENVESSHSNEVAESPTSPKKHSDVPSPSHTNEESRLSTIDDASTSQQYEEIDDFVASIQPSSPHLDSDTSPVLTLASKEDTSNVSDEASAETNLPSAIEDDRQSNFENKTDEEKAASLSGKSSGSNRGTIATESSTEHAVLPSDSRGSSSEDGETNKSATELAHEISGQESSNTSAVTSEVSASSASQTKSPVDIKKHVQEILNGSSPVSRGDKSPRMQDLCLITYDTSPVQSPESGSPLDDRKTFSLGSEAEELHRKQLAIEQEIKLLKEQQQKEAAAAFYVREIPNKPPPPYTPPSKTRTPKTPSVVPGTKEEIEQITEYSAKIIYKAYLSRNLDNITISDNTLNLIAKNIDKGCYKYVFDLCKEIARQHYNQFAEEAGPSWLHLDKKPVLAPVKPLDVNGLKKHLSKKLFQMFGFERQANRRENAIMKWSRKKRDHVDEVLVQEMQAEEDTWTNFDRDEALVKDRITNELMEMLLKETVQVLKRTVQKKMEGQ